MFAVSRRLATARYVVPAAVKLVKSWPPDVRMRCVVGRVIQWSCCSDGNSVDPSLDKSEVSCDRFEVAMVVVMVDCSVSMTAACCFAEPAVVMLRLSVVVVVEAIWCWCPGLCVRAG